MRSPAAAVTCVNYIVRRLRKTKCVELVHELECLKIYMICLSNWNDSSFDRDNNLGFLEEASESLKWIYPEYPVDTIAKAASLPVVSELLEKVKQYSKPKIEKDCLDFLDCEYLQCEFSCYEELLKLLHNILLLKPDTISLDVKKKIKYLQDNLDLFKQVSEFTAERCSNEEDLKKFEISFRDWTFRAACLSLLCVNMDPRMDFIRCDLHNKIIPSTSEVTRRCFAVLKASTALVKDRPAAITIVQNLVYFLENNLMLDPQGDGIQMFFADFLFLITFIMDTEGSSAKEDLILKQADAVVDEAANVVSSLIPGKIKENNFLLLLHDFLEKAKTIKVEVRNIYAHLFPDLSSFNFPRINVLGFIESLLEKLKDLSVRFPKYQLMMLQEGFLSLKQVLGDFSLMELENEHNDIKDLWIRVVDLAYNADNALSSMICSINSLWHDILSLSVVLEEVNLIKGEIKRIKDWAIWDTRALNSKTSPNTLLPLQASIPVVGNFVGFMDEVEEIKGQILRGSTQLDIISIVGMPGVGKTTLANKVYNDTSTQYHFHKRAWCTVSQTINSKKMLYDIASRLNDSDNSELRKLGEEDLAERVYRSLKRRRYLVVLDDIWDVSAWNELKMIFPEDNNGSRIIFTSRNQKLVYEAKSDCAPFPINPLPEEESWKLLEMKLFGEGSCPPNFVDIGKWMARQCKGLPLTLVLVAGILRENIKSMDWWKQVGGNLDSLIAEEGCKEILELSYKHLPEFLRPCFLYFGSFPEDEEIRVDRLTRLWISEGFVEKHDTKSLETSAAEYFVELVNRSLVITSKRSSTGEIKFCRVHDLLHNFCLAKGEEENIFRVVCGNEVASHPITMDARYAHYRLCISEPDCWISFLEHGYAAPFVHSLHSFYRSYKHFPRDENPKRPLENIMSLISHFIHHFKFLRVLNLSAHLPLSEFPEEITELRLLTSLVFWGGFVDIPSSIKRLENLEVLGLYAHSLWNNFSFFLPLTTWEMQKLREVHLREAFLPFEFCDEAPTLQNVQVFSGIMLPYESLKTFLRKIPKVRKLRCELQEAGEFIHIPMLDFPFYLESLHLRHQWFEKFSELQRFPFHFPSTLKKLNLEFFRLPWSEVSAISKLLNLEVLKLVVAFKGKTWNVEDDEFLKLKFLKLSSLDIEEWNVSDESFPCLETLVVEGCGDLEAIPSRFQNAATLKMIKVMGCRSTLNDSVWKVHEEQVELENIDLQVVVHKARDAVSHNSDLDSKPLVVSLGSFFSRMLRPLNAFLQIWPLIRSRKTLVFFFVLGTISCRSRTT